jgi:putative membrane protein (TIGR04086 family)
MAVEGQIRWGRILIGGLLIELTMFAIVLPLNTISTQTVYYLVPFLAAATGFLFGYWAARPLDSRFVLHGALVAVVASLIYVALNAAMGTTGSVPLLYHLSHGLRLLGGAAGGAFAGNRAMTGPATAPTDK